MLQSCQPSHANTMLGGDVVIIECHGTVLTLTLALDRVIDDFTLCQNSPHQVETITPADSRINRVCNLVEIARICLFVNTSKQQPLSAMPQCRSLGYYITTNKYSGSCNAITSLERSMHRCTYISQASAVNSRHMPEMRLDTAPLRTLALRRPSPAIRQGRH